MIEKIDSIDDFTIKCDKCGSGQYSLEYEFIDYGGFTGWESRLTLKCVKCDNKTPIDI